MSSVCVKWVYVYLLQSTSRVQRCIHPPYSVVLFVRALPSMHSHVCSLEGRSARVICHSSGESRCYGFVRFDTPKAALNAIEKLNARELQGKRLRVRRRFQATLYRGVRVANAAARICARPAPPLRMTGGVCALERRARRCSNATGAADPSCVNVNGWCRAIWRINSIRVRPSARMGRSAVVCVSPADRRC